MRMKFLLVIVFACFVVSCEKDKPEKDGVVTHEEPRVEGEDTVGTITTTTTISTTDGIPEGVKIIGTWYYKGYINSNQKKTLDIPMIIPKDKSITVLDTLERCKESSMSLTEEAIYFENYLCYGVQASVEYKKENGQFTFSDDMGLQLIARNDTIYWGLNLKIKDNITGDTTRVAAIFVYVR